MTGPPNSDPSAAPERAAHSLETLTILGRQLAGLHDQSSAASHTARAIVATLEPDRLLMVLDQPDTTAPTVAYTYHYADPRPNDPLIELVITGGPRVLARTSAEALSAMGAAVPYPVASWIGAPIVAGGHRLGAVSAVAETAGRFAPWQLEFVLAACTELGIALQNSRLLERLTRAKREWEQMVDAITQAFCVVDEHGIIRRANRAFSVIAHIPVTAVAGHRWRSVLPADWVDPVARALAAPDGRTAYELRSGGRIFTVAALSLPEPAGSAVLAFEDQTDKRQLQEQLVQSEKMSAIGQLIAGVAHDLNNPLASVVGFADFLVEEGDPPERMRESLQAIRHEAERAAGIVHNLLNFARKHEEERVTQPIAPLLETTLALLRNQLLGWGVEGELHTDADLPPVTIDRNQIQQVFVNLITNAAQAMHASGVGHQITVRAQQWLDGVAVTVTDDGPGVPAHLAPRVFEPFFTTRLEGEGTGLGLSISQGIVREHGGRITYAPAPAGGATFRVELPAAASPAPPPEARGPQSEPGPLRILVVDDEPHILHYMLATLKAWGHSVDVAADGAAALELATSQAFDVIIADLRMPTLGGREFFEALRRDHPRIARRVVFATGDTVGDDALQFLQSAGQPYLRKPFTLQELRTTLAGVARP